MKPILIIGLKGQVAWELHRCLLPFGKIVTLGRASNPPLDLARPDTFIPIIRQINPRLIVNAAAYTAVDKAEEEYELAEKINAIAPGILSEEAKKLGAGLIHYSTDYVFAGDADRPYREHDPLAPQCIYGHSKLAGEEAIRASGADHWILRTAWVYGARGNNFLLTMLRLMRERERIGVVADQTGSPTWSRLIAQVTAQMLAHVRLELHENPGTYHLTCLGETSWYGFASDIRNQAIACGLLPQAAAMVEPIATTDYPTPARRPAYSVLDTLRLTETFRIRPPHWKQALALCLEDLASCQQPV